MQQNQAMGKQLSALDVADAIEKETGAEVDAEWILGNLTVLVRMAELVNQGVAEDKKGVATTDTPGGQDAPGSND
jgi:DUF1009 family protein